MGGQIKGAIKMERKILGILIMTLLIVTAISVTGSKENNIILNSINQEKCEYLVNYNNGDQVDQEQNVWATDENGTWGYAKYGGEYAQSFVPTLPILTRVELALSSRGNPDDLFITIRDELEGEDLTSINIDGELFHDYSWVFFDFDDISITPGQKYYIIWHPEGNIDGNCYIWIYGSNDPYAYGKLWNLWQAKWECMENNSEILGHFEIDFSFRTYGYSDPPSNPEITGSTSGKAGTEYEYSLVSSEPDGDDIYYYIDWGDGEKEEWIGPFVSNVKQAFTHTWLEQSDYTVKAKSRDIFGFESDWTTLEVSMPKNKTYSAPFLDFLEDHTHMFPLLRQLIRL